jgi:tRNA U34 5-methylaminomethyl-2-thiouridine-forming methyltransferase MnmC
MQREIMPTADGSVTVSIPDMQVTFHSRHGAILESLHVFIEAGLKPLLHQYETLRIFEMGFGTGLNALLTMVEAETNQQQIQYETVEAFPLEEALVTQLNYPDQYPNWKNKFEELHATPWSQPIALTPYFTFQKHQEPLLNYSTNQLITTQPPTNQLFNLIYYDAFAPSVQPELWTADAFTQVFNLLQGNGILVTYCSKSVVRRAMEAAGFTVEKIPGPHGKREMVRAKKSRQQ